MDRRRFVAFAAFTAALVAVAVATQFTISPAPAQMAGPKVTGKFTDVVLKSFDGMGLPGIVQIQYRRATYNPGFKIEGEVNLGENHQELCTPARGSITVTLLDGSKHTFKAGDIFTVPLNMKAKLVTVDRKVGFRETYWSLNTKPRK